MLTPRPTLMRRVLAALDSSPSRIPVLLGGCGSGRTAVALQLRDRIGRAAAQYVDVERTATTPERFLRAVAGATPFPPIEAMPASTRESVDATLAFFDRVRLANGESATFILDEFLELRTFESFPGLRRVVHDTIDAIGSSGNRFVLTSRYTARSLRLLRERSSRFEVIHMPPLGADDTLDIIGPLAGTEAHNAEYLARTIQALADGRPSYVRALVDELATMRQQGTPGDAVGALASLLSPGGRLADRCGFCYELRLHRARGYGALKGILEILADEEGLTLTELSHRLSRTPGSTKDYLSWLEDVDLVTSRQKRYSFSDPLLRVWVRLYCRSTPPSEDDVAREVHRYALPRLPQPTEPAQGVKHEPALAMASAGSGIIEID